MMPLKEIHSLINSYDPSKITIGVLGGHSGLDVCAGAKKLGFRTLAVCQEGRDKTYSRHFKTRDGKGCVDETISLPKFSDLLKPHVQEELIKRNTIFIHNRYFWVYFDFARIEDEFKVPIFGSRQLVKFEERDVPKNQYYLLNKAGIRMPAMFDTPKAIDRLCIVKVAEAARGYERAFFFAANPKDYETRSKELIAKGTITKEALAKAIIEEYIVGAQVNFNFFYSPLSGELELMGTDTRRQTNLDGLLRLPAPEQVEALKHLRVKYIETGHVTCTVKESLLEKAFAAGEQFVAALAREHPPGIIGPFALQGAIASEEGREEFVCFDVSLRIPGSPGTQFTPYSGYLHGESISYGERIAMEIKQAIEQKKLHVLCS